MIEVGLIIERDCTDEVTTHVVEKIKFEELLSVWDDENNNCEEIQDAVDAVTQQWDPQHPAILERVFNQTYTKEVVNWPEYKVIGIIVTPRY